MKRALLGLFLGALVVLSACSSSTKLDGQLSAHSRPNTVNAQAKATTTTRRHPRTTTTRRHTTTTRRHGSASTAPALTTPTTPTTISQSGVAGAVLYDTNCAPDRPCSLQPGPAQLKLVTSKGVVVAQGRAADNGAFVLPAPPGNYTLLAKPPSKKQSCDAVAVTVSAGQYTTTRVHCA
jgi:hypothetical protein